MIGARRRALLAATAAAAALAGCAAPMTGALLRGGDRDGLPASVELDATPFFAQTAHQCGPASLATVLGAAGFVDAADPLRLERQVFVPVREGALQIEMVAAARRAGALAVPVAPHVRAALAEVAAGTPVLVLQNLGLDIAPRWHYAVLVGYDLGTRQAVLRSGTTRREAMSLDTFERTWARSGHWGFVALAPGRLPAGARESELADALLAFERVAPPDAAARAYDAALARWPSNLLFGIGLGNTLFAAGRPGDAATAFERAARAHDSAAAWSNLARVRLSLGERDAARHAAQRAVERAQSAEPQWIEAALATLAEAVR